MELDPRILIVPRPSKSGFPRRNARVPFVPKSAADTLIGVDSFGAAEKGHSEIALRGAVERLARSHGVHALVAAGYTSKAVEFAELGHGALSYALLAAAGIDRGPLKDRPTESAAGEVDVMDWFHFAAAQAGPLLEKLTGAPQGVQGSTQAKAFPILVLGK